MSGDRTEIFIDQHIFDLYGLTLEARDAVDYIDLPSSKDDDEADDDE